MILVGPYGAGKSAFCVQLARLLGGAGTPELLEELARVDPALGNAIQSPKRPLLPILLVGAREPLARALSGSCPLKRDGHHRIWPLAAEWTIALPNPIRLLSK